MKNSTSFLDCLIIFLQIVVTYFFGLSRYNITPHDAQHWFHWIPYNIIPQYYLNWNHILHLIWSLEWNGIEYNIIPTFVVLPTCTILEFTIYYIYRDSNILFIYFHLTSWYEIESFQAILQFFGILEWNTVHRFVILPNYTILNIMVV